MISVGARICPALLQLRGPRSPHWERRRVVPDVEPEIFPLDSLPRGVIEKIFIFFPGPHNFLGTTYLGDSIGTGVGMETEEVIEEMKMRLDTEWGGVR